MTGPDGAPRPPRLPREVPPLVPRGAKKSLTELDATGGGGCLRAAAMNADADADDDADADSDAEAGAEPDVGPFAARCISCSPFLLYRWSIRRGVVAFITFEGASMNQNSSKLSHVLGAHSRYA